MSLSLTQSLKAISPNLQSSFLGIGGVPPYIYSVRPNGAGGTINASTGLYTAPAVMGSTPPTLYDTIQVTDSLFAIAQAQVLVGDPLLLLCDIIQTYMQIPQGRVYLWDQKIFQPTDNGLYVAVSVPVCKPFGNNTTYDGSGNEINTVNVQAGIDIDILSRGPAARDQKEQVLLALTSDYSRSQQEYNSFHISRLSHNFLNLNFVDGAAIPYRYKISLNMLYAVQNVVTSPYFNTFQTPSVVTNP